MQWNEKQYKTSLKNKLEDERECSHYSAENNLPRFIELYNYTFKLMRRRIGWIRKFLFFISDNILKEIQLKKAISSHSFIQW